MRRRPSPPQRIRTHLGRPNPRRRAKTRRPYPRCTRKRILRRTHAIHALPRRVEARGRRYGPATLVRLRKLIDGRSSSSADVGRSCSAVARKRLLRLIVIGGVTGIVSAGSAILLRLRRVDVGGRRVGRGASAEVGVVGALMSIVGHGELLVAGLTTVHSHATAVLAHLVAELGSVAHVDTCAVCASSAEGVQGGSRGRDLLTVGLQLGPLDLLAVVVEIGEAALGEAVNDENDASESDDTLRATQELARATRSELKTGLTPTTPPTMPHVFPVELELPLFEAPEVGRDEADELTPVRVPVEPSELVKSEV